MQNGIYRPASSYADDGTPCLRMYNINDGRIVPRDLKRMQLTQAEIEQQFTRIDSGVAGLSAAQRRARKFRSALLQAAVSGRLVPTEAHVAVRDGRTYQSGRELLAEVLGHQGSCRGNPRAASVGPDTTRLPSLPEGWIWASLNQLLGELRNGVSVKPDAAKGTPILRISAVRPMSVDLTDIRFLGSSKGDFSTFTIRLGDLLFTRYN